MSFSAQVASFGPRAIGRINAVRQGVIIKLFSSVIRDTPVLTGQLRANWQLTEGTPATGEVNGQAPNKTGLSVTEAQQITKTDGDIPVFLANNLPYAYGIEFEGRSKGKSPEGMMRRNVVRFGRLISVEVANKQL